MSKNITRIIPKDVGRIPVIKDKKAISRLLDALGITYEAIGVVCTEQIRFIDCGMNLEYVRCRFCHHDVTKWWGEAMSIKALTDFGHRIVQTPCCHRQTALEDLEYCLDAGFGRFSIEMVNAGDISYTDMYELSSELGTEMKKIVARY